jgi:hypothetical protein
MEPPRPCTPAELRQLLTMAFAEARRSLHEPDRTTLALRILDNCHNVPRIIADHQSGVHPLSVPRGARFDSIADYWTRELVPLFTQHADTYQWLTRAFPGLVPPSPLPVPA